MEGQENNMSNGDLSCFIRMGTDFTSNYYEYEIPLRPTPHFSSSPDEIWPSENEIDIAFEIFQIAKQERNFNSLDINLSPSGREINSKLEYSSSYKILNYGVALGYKSDPYHIKYMDDYWYVSLGFDFKI